MKTYSSILILCLMIISNISWAKDYTNHLKIKAEQEQVQQAVKSIPIYKEKIEGHYQILGPVNGQDILTTKKSAIMYQMRVQAYKMGANAIMEFKCDPLLKKAILQCNGFAIYQN